MQKFTQSLLIILLLCSINSFGQLPTNLKTGLLAYYPFSGNAGDSSGNGNHGTVVNATLTTDRFGNNNSAYFFNGNAYITIPSSSLLNLTADFTISSWFNMATNTSNNAQMILSKHDGDVGNDGYIYGIWNPNNNNINQIVNFQANNQFNTNTYPSASGVVALNTWYNFIVSYSKTDNVLKYYLNGNLIMSKNISISVLANNLNLTVGYSKSSYSTYLDFFNGKIDDIAIYTRVLTDAEAVQLYNYNSVLPITVNLKNRLLAYYPFNGNVGDSSGNAKHGTAVGAVTYGTDHNGSVNSALSLTGGFNNGRVTTNSSMFNFQYTDSFTVAFWFLDAGSSSGRIISTENSEGNFRISTYGSGIYAVAFGSSLAYLYDTVQLNQWNHIVYTFSNRSVRLYKNGVLKASQTNNSTETFNYGTAFTIGSKAASAYDTWNGKIDEVALWGRAINANEVAALYNSTGLLPIQLLSFNAKPTDNNVTLNWQTANAINFSHFELEYCADGSNFTKLATITSNLSNAYTYIHSNPLPNNYYRLKMVDKDGTFSYSAVEHVALVKKSLFISVYPNPVTDNSVVAITVTKASKAIIVVTDMAGKVVSRLNKDLIAGPNNFSLNSMIFISGYYQITVATDDDKQTIKILK